MYYIKLHAASFRDVAKECNAITSLLPLLSFHENIDMRLQAMRAVGNLCIDHGESLCHIIIVYVHVCDDDPLTRPWMQ